MKRKFMGFISEHTAEYTLVPALTSILKYKYKTVVPVFPWMSREANSLSAAIHNHYRFQVVGLFPKRPKIEKGGNIIQIKVNHEFVESANVAMKLKIPMLVGTPIVTSIFQLNESVNCVWIKLTESMKEYYEFRYNTDTKGNISTLQENNAFLTHNDIIKFTIENSGVLNFREFIQAIRKIKIEGVRFNYRWTFGVYKPIYFLLREEKY